MKNTTVLFVLGAMLLVILLTGFGCNGQAATAESEAPANEANAKAAPAQKPVAKIVFVDKENCCKCTQERTDASWSALEKALEGKSIPVERIHMDTQAEQAAAFLEMKSMVAVPGIYLMDADGALVDLMQGETTQAKLVPFFK